MFDYMLKHGYLDADGGASFKAFDELVAERPKFAGMRRGHHARVSPEFGPGCDWQALNAAERKYIIENPEQFVIRVHCADIGRDYGWMSLAQALAKGFTERIAYDQMVYDAVPGGYAG